MASFAAIVAGVAAALRLFLANACEFHCDFGAVYTLAVHIVDSVTGISRVVVLLGEHYNKGVVRLEVQVTNSAVTFENLLQCAGACAPRQPTHIYARAVRHIVLLYRPYPA